MHGSNMYLYILRTSLKELKKKWGLRVLCFNCNDMSAYVSDNIVKQSVLREHARIKGSK